ncbi:Alanine racemase [Nostocoides japonicum T1-X7]|uniref:Alanine racemase n=1 Tax=Nostocoides japonicum T1-X7 TaxID=1194083 RepID=A0A077M139_9MICO|nr:alanine racemase [Tetrasphaera japonica]CCH80058.1 Alanine racemase [Tetrasphaera japonica T1-X7]
MPSVPPHATLLPAGSSACVEIDLDAIRDNVAELGRRAGSAEVMAVVKADAYGHGVLPAARAALAGGATWLGVAQLEEALRVRAAGIDAPLLSWLYPPGADLAGAVAADIDVTASAVWALDAIRAAADTTGRTARVQLKVDTGLLRNGAYGPDWTDLVAAAGRACAEGSIEVTGVWSHFVYADEPQHPTVRRQQERFEEAVRDLERAGIRPGLRHLANSAATLTNPAVHYDLVRPGLACYGLSPVPQLGGPSAYGLREAMRLTAALAGVKRVKAGEGVSYGHQYVTERETVLGLVPLGYADGVPRHGTNVGPLLVGGQRTRVAGRVCMDQLVVDLGPAYAGGAGDPVVVFGREADGEPTAQEWAEAIGTINYEIVTRVSGRLPRVHIGGED